MNFDIFIKNLEGIQSGDTVYVISDISLLAYIQVKNKEVFDGNKYIDILIEKIGNEGTLLFPTFNWDFCKGVPFDYHNTPSRTGHLSQLALKRADFKRTKHPIYSFAVWGKHTNDLVSLENINSWGIGSPFELIEILDAKCLVIGLGALAEFTGLHHIEKVIGVSFRQQKKFSGEYIDKNGVRKIKTYEMYVRNLEIDAKQIKHSIIEDFLLEIKAIKKMSWKGVDIFSYKVKDVYDVMKLDIKYNAAKGLYIY